ncbi:MAG: PASTA domain-containing protein [Bacteroidetes bacterium]|nr:PASTA domain-containing protein [Bacteroidota bacterium]
MKLRNFLFSKAFILTIVSIGVAWVVLISMSMLSLQLNSRPWSERSVPNLLHLSLDSAFAILAELELEAIHLDSVYSVSAVPGSILEQTPKEGSLVKSGRPVYLTTFRIKPPSESISVYEGQDAILAKIILERKGFIVQVREEPNIILEGKVVRVESKGFPLSSDDRRVRGAQIVLVIGKSSLVKVRIPYLLGLSLSETSSKLTESSLSLGYVEYSDSVITDSDTTNARVFRQFPSSSRGRVKAGTSIDVILKN